MCRSYILTGPNALGIAGDEIGSGPNRGAKWSITFPGAPFRKDRDPVEPPTSRADAAVRRMGPVEMSRILSRVGHLEALARTRWKWLSSLRAQKPTSGALQAAWKARMVAEHVRCVSLP